MAMRRQTRLASESALFLLVLGASLVLVNVLGFFGVNLRADTTEAHVFSLSKGSKHLASSLDDEMEIRAYFSKELPPPYNAMGRYVRDLLSEYRDASGGKITVRFIEPKTDEEKQAAERDGVDRVSDQKLEDDSFSVQEGYRGISFHYLGDTKSIRRVDTTEGLEYEITQTIKELLGQKTTVGVLTGYDGPTLEKGLSSLKQYLPTYEMKAVDAEKPIPKDIKALLIIHPEKKISETTLRYIDQYVMHGGSLGIWGGGIKVDMNQGAKPTATPIDSGLNTLLEKWGVKLESNIVADAQCGRARMPTNIPGLAIPVPYPPVPIISFDDQQRKHPALFGINNIGLPYAVRLALNDALKGDKQVTRTILARSTPKSWLMDGDTIDLQAREQWQVPGYDGPYVMGVAIEGKLPSAFAPLPESTPDQSSDADAKKPKIESPERAEKDARVLVFGSGYFMRDEFLPKPQPGNNAFSGGVAFALDGIDWLAQEGDLIEIRAKTVEDPALEVPLNVKEAEATIRDAIADQDETKAKQAFETRKAAMAAWDDKKALYRWGNTLAIPGVFALFGVVRWRMRRARRSRMKL